MNAVLSSRATTIITFSEAKMVSKTDLTLNIEQRVSCDVGEFVKNTTGRSTITNCITPTEKSRFVLRANSFSQPNKTIRLKVWGSKSGMGAQTIHFSMLKNKTFDKYQVIESIPLGGTDCHFHLEIVLTAIDKISQSVNSVYMPDITTPFIKNKVAKIKFADDGIFRIYGECNHASDVITINKYEMAICG